MIVNRFWIYQSAEFVIGGLMMCAASANGELLSKRAESAEVTLLLTR